VAADRPRRRIKAHGRRVCSGSPTQWIRHADGPPLGRRVLGGGGGRRHLCPLVGTARIREVDPRAAFSRCRVRVRVTARSRSAALRSTPWRRRPPRPWREWRRSARELRPFPAADTPAAGLPGTRRRRMVAAAVGTWGRPHTSDCPRRPQRPPLLRGGGVEPRREKSCPCSTQ